MGDTERPIPERLGDQHEQAQHLTRTGNGPTVEDEQRLLAEQYGAPDMAGFYSGPDLADQVADESTEDDEQDHEPAAEGDAAPAEDTVTEGESA
jgi:hypothetical protein